LKNNAAAAEPVKALFPPQNRDWALPVEAPLTPRALRRVSRECVDGTFDRAAAALNEDWSTSWDGRDLQRWTEKVGTRMVAERDIGVTASESGRCVQAIANPPALMVLGLDGGRVQMRERDPETKSRWKENKVATVTSYVPGDGKDVDPRPLVTTHVATMEKTEAFGCLVRAEAEVRAWRYAAQVIAIADCGNWIDPLLEREFPKIVRIADWAHAEEHLHEAGRAVHPTDPQAAKKCSEPWVAWLAKGQVDAIVAAMRKHAAAIGKPRKTDGREHPRRVLTANVGYFEKNKAFMNYPYYRSMGWPIGSGNVEAGVKQFNKRVKGTEQFWQPAGIEAMLCLRGLFLSQDDRWHRYWSTRPAYLKRAA
jgi:hypothetical protein